MEGKNGATGDEHLKQIEEKQCLVNTSGGII